MREGTGWLRHARALDERHSAPGTAPIVEGLRLFTPTRGLVFGVFGEASADVHERDVARGPQQRRLPSTHMHGFFVRLLAQNCESFVVVVHRS